MAPFAPLTPTTVLSGQVMKSLPAPLARDPKDDSPPMICQQVFDSISIHANGDIVCWCVDVEGKRVYGNVFKDKIFDIYNGPAYQEIRNWMLSSRPDTWCPAIESACPLRVVPAKQRPETTNCQIKILKLEPVTYCNLQCPVCPVETGFKQIPALRETRGHKLLPLETMLDVVAQLPDLEIIEYFDYGEPFIHKDTIAFLREVRRTRPGVQIVTSTNGTVMTPAQIRAIATEALMDKVIFSIDGASEESFRKYRVGGSFSKAFGKMKSLVDACREAGTWRKYVTGPLGYVQITWQYILFEWNDSDEEIALAQELAQSIGVPMQWIITAGYGASKRFSPGADLAAQLIDPPNSYIYGWHVEPGPEKEKSGNEFNDHRRIRVACQLLALPYSEDQSMTGYCARLKCDERRITAPRGSTILFDVEVENRVNFTWNVARTDFLRIGVQLRPAARRNPFFRRIASKNADVLGQSESRELPGANLPQADLRTGKLENVPLRVHLPGAAGEYELLLDVVHEGVCWFSERGSAPLICHVSVN